MTSKETSPVRPFSIGETTNYIAALSQELAELARAQRLDFLAYLLEMAATEAIKHKHSPKPLERVDQLHKKKPSRKITKKSTAQGNLA